MEGAISIYLRLIDYNSNAITSRGTNDNNIISVKDTLDTANTQFIKILSYSSDVEQTLNIGSISSGAGAGKIQFNPLRITKFMDALSPLLFQHAASGTPFKTAEIFFTHAGNVLLVTHTHKLVAIKTVSWAATSGEPGMNEMVTFEYGGLVITVNQQTTVNNVLQGGWNRVKNINDNDVTAIIT